MFTQCFLAFFVKYKYAFMPKTPRPVSAAPSTISRPPSGSFSPVSTLVSVPVIASVFALTSSSGSGFSSVPLSAVQPRVYHY